jgi:fatty-acid peroxygenase
MAPIPPDKSLDGMLALLSDGYTSISKRYQRYQFDIFETRLMLRKVVCVMGEMEA